MSVSRLAITFAVALLAAHASSQAATPTVADALKLSPVQPGIQYDIPAADEAKACKIANETIGAVTGWVVRGADGAILRHFADSNKDNVVDTWCYYRGGLEVYRDGDVNFNGKADQYRWFHTAGSRWAIDSNEDGKPDSWKSISAEEASEEVIAALRDKDAARFQRLMLGKEDAAKLGLAKPVADKLAERLAAAPKAFQKLVADAKVDAKAEFTDFGGLRPGAVPAGARDGSKDLLVYENVWAMVHTGDQHQQLQLGSMIFIDGCWKLIDGPTLGAADSLASGFFFDGEGSAAAGSPPQVATMNESSEKMQKILESIEKVDADLAAAAADKKSALNAQRADLLEQLVANAAEPAEREQWIKQLADGISSAAQEGAYPEGLERLTKLEAKLAEEKASEELLSHVEFRRLVAAHWIEQADPKTDYAKSQAAWLKQLEDFVTKHKTGEHVAEALYQLGLFSEYAGDNAAAQKWYERLVADFASNLNAAKAKGAVRRLTAEGKPLALKGPAIQGGAVDLAQYKGKAVVVHYWSTSSPLCKADHELLSDVYKKFGGAKFEVLGVSLDPTKEELVTYLKANPQLKWKHIFEPGGFDNRLATEMGVITCPLMILVDDKGNVVNANIQGPELDEALTKLLSARVANAK